MQNVADLPLPVQFWVSCDALREEGQLRVPTNFSRPA